MKKVHWEIVASILFVFGSTYLVYGQLENISSFWDAQALWSLALIAGWMVVSAGYFHQGWMVHQGHSAANVSAFLPSVVFLVQCILFVKGIYFNDWSLILGAVIVNSGVVFSLYQILQAKRRSAWRA
ncbi:hypothetical protein A2950_01025 [Candidatus Kaiserbacteria bacterium RIFCSPLOWO2_01_FULL_55_19]|uniref:Uncharacterized protein n=1 Tax=Candidatus Kaiserbacteria bacterium RIFCSPLOWO2_01_FULL_55_19 TaxID=1798516 RepID=A0A1F6ESK0_9BACT|nr:MAG: hypothetical protein A2950_01025 [Candidatus Kaiserbacteria bacterium RIFCSPLOWO2_01_FULL_55_19]